MEKLYSELAERLSNTDTLTNDQRLQNIESILKALIAEKREESSRYDGFAPKAAVRN